MDWTDFGGENEVCENFLVVAVALYFYDPKGGIKMKNRTKYKGIRNPKAYFVYIIFTQNPIRRCGILKAYMKAYLRYVLHLCFIIRQKLNGQNAFWLISIIWLISICVTLNFTVKFYTSFLCYLAEKLSSKKSKHASMTKAVGTLVAVVAVSILSMFAIAMLLGGLYNNRKKITPGEETFDDGDKVRHVSTLKYL